MGMSLLFPVVLGGLTIAISALAIFRLLRTGIDTGKIFLLRSAQWGAVMAFVYWAGAWSYSSWHLRSIMLAAFICVLLYRAVRCRSLPWSIDRLISPMQAAARTVSLLALALLNILQIDGRFHTGRGIELRFPLAAGTYCVIQGGRGPLANPFHFFHGPSRYALDIVRLNPMGNRASGPGPSRAEEYEIFGDTILAPCDCDVLQALDIYPDQPPGHAYRAGGAGNRIVLRCGDLEILLAHLQQGSVTVAAGGMVREGEPLARVGNSGNSAEPHLHIQAMRFERRNQRVETISIPITFDGRFLAINDIVTSAEGYQLW